MMTNDELEQIDGRVAAATPGPWKPRVLWHDGAWPVGPYTRSEAQAKADSDFIAHARGDVPELVAEIRRLRASNFFEALSKLWSACVRARGSGQELAEEIAEQLPGINDLFRAHFADRDQAAASDRSDAGPAGREVLVAESPAGVRLSTRRRPQRTEAEAKAALVEHYQRVVNEEITTVRIYEDELERLSCTPDVARFLEIRRLHEESSARRDQAAADLGFTVSGAR